MERLTIRFFVAERSNDKWMKLHFTRLLQRGAKIVGAAPKGPLQVEDVADLWFPVPKETNLFEAVECILVTHRIANNLVRLVEVNKVNTSETSTCTDWDAVFNPYQNS